MHSVTRMLVLLAVVVTFVMGGAPAAGVQDPASGSDSPHTIVELDAPGGEDSRALRINERGQIVGWGLRDGATRAFIALPTSLAAGLLISTPTAIADDLEVTEVVARAQHAIRREGTYRYEVFALNAVDGEPDLRGEVEIGRGFKTRAGDGSDLTYFDGQKLYSPRSDGSWWVRVPTIDQGHALLGFLDSSPELWELAGTASFNGRLSYVIEHTIKVSASHQRVTTFWIDATTFLPHKLILQSRLTGMEPHGIEVLFTDFGAPVDIRPPAAALPLTPTPEPLP